MKTMTAVVLSMLLAGCGVSHQQTATIGAAHGSPVAQPAASPVPGSGPSQRLAPQAVPGGQAITTPGTTAGSDPHNPTTGMVN
jgi:hypothetical protein